MTLLLLLLDNQPSIEELRIDLARYRRLSDKAAIALKEAVTLVSYPTHHSTQLLLSQPICPLAVLTCTGLCHVCTVIARMGDTCSDIYFVRVGEIRVTRSLTLVPNVEQVGQHCSGAAMPSTSDL